MNIEGYAVIINAADGKEIFHSFYGSWNVANTRAAVLQDELELQNAKVIVKKCEATIKLK